MQFKALLSLLSLAAVVTALPASADSSSESNTLTPLDARALDAFDPARDLLESQSYVAVGPPGPQTLISQVVTQIFPVSGSGPNTIYLVAETYFANFTWIQQWSHANPGSSDQVEERKITERTAATSGSGGSEAASITAAFEAQGFSFGAESSSETKHFSMEERSKGTEVTRRITCTAGETTFFYQRRYNFIARLWFLSDVSGQKAKMTAHSGWTLNSEFSFQVDSDNVATLNAPLKSGSKTTLPVSAIKPQYNSTTLPGRVNSGATTEGGPQIGKYMRLGHRY